MFRSFEKSCPPCEIRPPDWNLSPVLRCLSRPPFEPLKLASNKHLTWKTSFLLALASAKRVSELHGLSFLVCHSGSWRSCTFSFLPDYVGEIENPSLPDPCFNKFTDLSLDDFVDSDRDELLLCPIRAFHKYLSWMEQYCPEIKDLFISTGMRKIRVSCNTISFWLRSVISFANSSVSE